MPNGAQQRTVFLALLVTMLGATLVLSDAFAGVWGRAIQLVLMAGLVVQVYRMRVAGDLQLKRQD